MTDEESVRCTHCNADLTEPDALTWEIYRKGTAQLVPDGDGEFKVEYEDDYMRVEEIRCRACETIYDIH